jgi:thiamine-monophosphate kinase
MFGSESQFVQWLRRHAPKPRRGLVVGIGDDAALIKVTAAREWILTSDLSIEGIHFLPSLHPPASVGHRALARSLSDVAAMGGTPRYALVSLAISRRVSAAWVKAFYGAMTRLARRYGVAIVGGDTAVVPDGITVDVVLVGEVARGRALLRSGARPGDRIFVSGRIGLSALGLRLLKAGTKGAAAWSRAALKAHLYPEPQCTLGEFLAKRGLASAVIDISDGLSTDLARLCDSSQVGARLQEKGIPIPDLGSQGRRLGLDPLQLALDGGEDYQLLFTVPEALAAHVPRRFGGRPLHRIGVIQKSRKILLLDPTGRPQVLKPSGYDHFQEMR